MRFSEARRIDQGSELSRMKRSPLTTEQQELAVKYLPLARSLAKPFKRAWPTHHDDFESAACSALVEAAGTFDPARGVKFSTFVRHRVWGSLRDVQRSLVALGWRCDPKHAPLITSLPRDPEGKGRMLGSDHCGSIGWEEESDDQVKAILRPLSEREKRIVRMAHVYGFTSHQIAARIGLSQSRVHTICRAAIEQLRGSQPPNRRHRTAVA
jgi:RNA polymerase sigma factor (sigma-70 family)